jgi:5-(carboxyamino)imidazole ribonucleotide mutase
MNRQVVEIIMGSDSDWPTMQVCHKHLEEYSIHSRVTILSAHRTPKTLTEHIIKAESNGILIFIAGAGLNASLAGCIAALTVRPVISVPICNGPLNGIDALLASSQMPSGIPVATMTIGQSGARNAALLAIQILALTTPELYAKLRDYKAAQANEVDQQNQLFQQRLNNEFME